MGSNGSRRVPEALQNIVRRWQDREMPPQSGSRWSRPSWAREFPSHRDFLAWLPDRIDRAEAAQHARDATTPEGAVRAFLVTMIWGYGPVGYGPYRAARVLRENPGAEARLAEIARIARDMGGRMSRGGRWATWASHSAPSTCTSALLPVRTSREPPPYWNAVVTRWLATHANLRISIDTWRTAEYEDYIDALKHWSTQLGLPRTKVEELIFIDGITREGSAVWGESWASTDEPPEPAEINLDAHQAISHLKGLFGTTEPGTASDAQPHLDALERLIEHAWPTTGRSRPASPVPVSETSSRRI